MIPHIKSFTKRILRLGRLHLMRWLPPRGKYCVACGHSIFGFLPYREGKVVRLMLALEVIGSDINNFACPWCGAHDRERHLLLYLRAVPGILEEMRGKSILHFAPERHIPRCIKSAEPKDLLMCDINPRSSDIRSIDITRMHFPPESFDVLIANHVLEHVSSDARALSEIGRILKPGGFAILQTPYSPVLNHTWEDAGITSDEARLAAYGQEDHVRLYGKDIIDRFARLSNLIPDVRHHHDVISEYDARKFGINPKEPFLLFRKPPNTSDPNIF
jgi:SAM-dependent methyltransferase